MFKNLLYYSCRRLRNVLRMVLPAESTPRSNVSSVNNIGFDPDIQKMIFSEEQYANSSVEKS